MVSANRMPVLFIGHGSPENALEKNEFTTNWEKVAKIIPKPKAIVCISAHWLKEGTAVTSSERPKTIHDFYGFPDELYKISYPAKGSPQVSDEIKKMVKTTKVESDDKMGLDHGTWSVLRYMYPKADVPVVQLSLDYYLPLEMQYHIGIELSPLRDKGVLIIGSGNLVHNLMTANFPTDPYDWAVDFNNFVKRNLVTRNDDALVEYTGQRTASLAHPTNDHYLPLLYVLGASEKEQPQIFNEKIVAGSIGMISALFGGKEINF